MSAGGVPIEADATGGVGPAPEEARLAPASWRRTLVIAGAGLIVVVVAVVLVLSLSGGKKDLTVTFSLYDFEGTSSCTGGTGGYNDIGPGTAVVVKDNDGHVIGTSDLGDGQHSAPEESDGFTPGGCIWQTTLHGVPTGKDFYSVEVGHRGAQIYSASQLEKRKWAVSLTLGGS